VKRAKGILYGSPARNFINALRSALLEKQAEHDFIVISTALDEAFLQRNLMGKTLSYALKAYLTGQGASQPAQEILIYA